MQGQGRGEDLIQRLRVLQLVLVQLVDVLDLLLAMAISCAEQLVLLSLQGLRSPQEVGVGAGLDLRDGLLYLLLHIHLTRLAPAACAVLQWLEGPLVCFPLVSVWIREVSDQISMQAMPASLLALVINILTKIQWKRCKKRTVSTAKASKARISV